MAINKVVYGGQTKIDLTADTVTAATLAQGITAHDKSGEQITGTMTPTVLPTLTTPAATTDVLDGKEYIDGNGTKQTGNMAEHVVTDSSQTLVMIDPYTYMTNRAGLDANKYYRNNDPTNTKMYAAVDAVTPSISLSASRLNRPLYGFNSSGVVGVDTSLVASSKYMRSIQLALGGDIYRVYSDLETYSTAATSATWTTDFDPIGILVVLETKGSATKSGTAKLVTGCYGFDLGTGLQNDGSFYTPSSSSSAPSQYIWSGGSVTKSGKTLTFNSSDSSRLYGSYYVVIWGR